MRVSVAILLGSLLLAASSVALPSESVDSATLVDTAFSSTAGHSNAEKGNKGGSKLSCKVFPGDREWPSDKLFEKLGKQSAGGIVKPDPLAKPCYTGSAFDAAKCGSVSENWADPYLQ